MKALFFVLNKVDRLEPLLQAFVEHRLYGATIFESQGMAQTLVQNGDQAGIYLGIAIMINNGTPFNKTIMMVLKDEEVQIAEECIQQVVGDISDENGGILFTVPIDHIKAARPIG